MIRNGKLFTHTISAKSPDLPRGAGNSGDCREEKQHYQDTAEYDGSSLRPCGTVQYRDDWELAVAVQERLQIRHTEAAASQPLNKALVCRSPTYQNVMSMHIPIIPLPIVAQTIALGSCREASLSSSLIWAPANLVSVLTAPDSLVTLTVRTDEAPYRSRKSDQAGQTHVTPAATIASQSQLG
jgi:hypothetical protein